MNLSPYFSFRIHTKKILFTILLISRGLYSTIYVFSGLRFRLDAQSSFVSCTLKCLLLVLFILSMLSAKSFAATPEPLVATNNSSLLANANPVTELSNVVVYGQRLNSIRDQIIPSLGATKYTMTQQQIQDQALGDNAPFSETLLRFPGIAKDSYGQVHVRGEHANLQYQIDGVLLPEGITGFGQQLSTRFVDSLSLVTGALPAQYGFKTAGVVDIQTKSGLELNGGEVSVYGGSFGTVSPSFEFGETVGKVSLFFTGGYLRSNLGIENPTSSYNAIHDETTQFKGFGLISYLIDEFSKINLILGGNISNFQIPNNPNQAPQYTLEGVEPFNSSQLNENQSEQNFNTILSYIRKQDDLSIKESFIFQNSSIFFRPDTNGDLIFNGEASQVYRNIYAEGNQGDFSYVINDYHTLRFGNTFQVESAVANSTNQVFSELEDESYSTIPEEIVVDSHNMGYLWGFYLQDEWKITDKLILNYGGRFDSVNGYINENQLSPRINMVFEASKNTTFHAGYARYFTPPPLELIQQGAVQKFQNTSNASEVTQNSPLQSERSHYFDIGVVQKVGRDFTCGLDAYYKIASQQLDEGQFASALVYSPFNYQYGRTCGIELTPSYQHGGFTAYANAAVSQAMGKKIDSAQFLSEQDELNYINNNWVHMDHDQLLSLSSGVSYNWKNTKVYLNNITGTGLRSGFANTSSMPAYSTFNVGVEHSFHPWNHSRDAIKLRLDLVNLCDSVYELRDGTGIGVQAPQYGMRRGLFGTISYVF